MTVKGLKNLEKQLKKLENNVKNLPSGNNVELDKLFTNKFMSKNTNFKSFEEFTDHFKITQERFDKMENSELDVIIKEHTKFESWQHFIDSAVEFQLFN